MSILSPQFKCSEWDIDKYGIVVSPTHVFHISTLQAIIKTGDNVLHLHFNGSANGINTFDIKSRDEIFEWLKRCIKENYKLYADYLLKNGN